MVDKASTGSVNLTQFISTILGDDNNPLFTMLVGLIYKSVIRIMTANPPIPKTVSVTINIVSIQIEVDKQRPELNQELKAILNSQ